MLADFALTLNNSLSMNGLSNSFLVSCGFSLKLLWDEIDGSLLRAHEHLLWVHVSPIPLPVPAVGEHTRTCTPTTVVWDGMSHLWIQLC